MSIVSIASSGSFARPVSCSISEGLNALFLIASPFMRRFPCSDNANPPIVCYSGIDMNNYQESDRANHSNGMPTLLRIFKAIRDDDMQRIVPNAFREVEADAMLQ